MKLAIKGHPTRGKEVINLLKTLGANSGYIDTFVGFYYYIECGSIRSSDVYPTHATIFTLEEFLYKYPFKIGDFVSIPEYESEVRICEMQWDGFEIQYKVYRVDEEEWYTSDELLDYNDNPNKMIKDMDEKDKAKATPEISTLNMSAIDYNNGLVGYEIPVGYEFDTVIDNKVVLKKLKPQYPKTYEECCATLGYENREISFDTHTCNFDTFFENFYKLYICRYAYWKIAGEQMELDKPWEPDWESYKDNFCIITYKNKPIRYEIQYRNRILAFPTEEMRDAFYENFKDLIEECKELL